jgi:hypothetical protein
VEVGGSQSQVDPSKIVRLYKLMPKRLVEWFK